MTSTTKKLMDEHLFVLEVDGLKPWEYRYHVRKVRELRALLKRETISIYDQRREEKLARLSANVVPFAERLKEYRKAKGWTVGRLAKHLGVSPVVSRQWELGKAQPNLKSFLKVVLLSSRGAQWWLGM